MSLISRLASESPPVRSASGRGARFTSCSYIDLTTHAPGEVAGRYAQSSADVPASSASGVWLRTCHRLEWYEGLTPARTEITDFLPEARSVEGHAAVATRLAQIAAGARSLIVGERFVFDQVSAAFTNLGADHCLLHAAAEALSVAVEARRAFKLSAVLDYTGLCRLLLEDAAGDVRRSLVVIGGGVLARALAAEFARSRAVVLVTRNPKKLRRNLAAAGVSATTCRITQADEVLVSQPYDLIIATSGVDALYREGIDALAAARDCRTTLDLCAIPVLEPGPDYRHLHDPDVITIIEDANREVAARATEARAWIADRMGGQR
jgi:glutamyl-tRNA reductase